MQGSRRKIGILTGGGDCPGLNAAIRAIAKTAILNYNMEVIGVKDGFLGLIENSIKSKMCFPKVISLILIIAKAKATLAGSPMIKYSRAFIS